MERTTIEIQLPKSGAIAVLYESLSTGDNRRIRRATLAGMHVNYNTPDKKPKIENMSGESLVDAEDVTLDCLVKEIRNKDGQVVADKKQFIYDLPEEDGNILYDRANKLTENSILSEAAKKKS